MTSTFFVSDLHGNVSRYEALFREILHRKPSFVFLGGDLLPNIRKSDWMKGESAGGFITDYLIPGFRSIQKQLACNYPDVFLIMGNDDQGIEEEKLLVGETMELWRCLNNKRFRFGPYLFLGYPFVPPTPFQLKDWEKYDLSHQLNAGCLAPGEGYRTRPAGYDPQTSTIAGDLEELSDGCSMEKAVFLFHTPPFQSFFDQARPAGTQEVIAVGSVAVQQFIKQKQPYITMHGHVHESVGITGQWKQQSGRTISFSAAHDGPGLALVIFKLDNPADSERILL